MNTNTTPLAVAALAAAALASPLTASAGSIEIGTAYAFDLRPVDEAFVESQNRYEGVNGYFAGSDSVELGGFTAATGLSIDRLESVSIRLDGGTGTPGSGAAYGATGLTVFGGPLNAIANALSITERDAPTGAGIALPNQAVDQTDADSDLSVFASDTVGLGVFSAVAFYGSLGQVTGDGRAFASTGFANITYTFSDAPTTPAAVPTPSAALAGLLGLGAVALKRRKQA